MTRSNKTHWKRDSFYWRANNVLVYIKYFFISCTQNNYTFKADFLSGSFRKANLRPGSPLGGKETKSASEASREVWSKEGKRWRRPSPSPVHRWAHFARWYFSHLNPFPAFFSHSGAWSQAKENQLLQLLRVNLNSWRSKICNAFTANYAEMTRDHRAI